MSVDCERWLNELTHKYLEYVRKCHFHCYRGPLQNDVRDEYERLKYGDNDDKDMVYIKGVQQKRQLDGKYLNEESLNEFSNLLVEANKELEDFLNQ